MCGRYTEPAWSSTMTSPEASLQADIRAQADAADRREDAERRMRAEIEAKIRSETSDAVFREMTEQVRRDIESRISGNLEARLRKEIRAEVEESIRKEIEAEACKKAEAEKRADELAATRRIHAGKVGVLMRAAHEFKVFPWDLFMPNLEGSNAKFYALCDTIPAGNDEFKVVVRRVMYLFPEDKITSVVTDLAKITPRAPIGCTLRIPEWALPDRVFLVDACVSDMLTKYNTPTGKCDSE